MSVKEIRILSHEEVIDCGGTDMKLAVMEVRKVFRAFEAGDVLQPEKTTLKFTKFGEEDRMGLVNILPAYVNIDGEEIYSCKSLGAMPSNSSKGLPRASGVITLFDPVDKSPICLMDAQVISAMRTGAVSALAAEKLLPGVVDEVCLIGAGVNMRTQLLGIKQAKPRLKKAYVFSRGNSKNDFAEKMSERLQMEIIPIYDPEKAVRNSSFIITCLPNGVAPVVKSDWLSDTGLTLFNIGGHETEYQALGKMDRIIADLWAQARKRGTQPHALAVKNAVIEENRIEEIAKIFTGDLPGRKSDGENIFFSPTGLGMTDAVIAHKIHQRAAARGIGTKVKLWGDHRWI